MTESDGIEETVRGTMRTALTAAGYAGQQIAQAITASQRARQQASEQQAEQLQARYDAERAAARARVAVVHREEWWNTTEPQNVADVWVTAQGWREQDPDVERAAVEVERQVRDRYGISPAELAAQQQTARVADLRRAAERQSDYDLAREWAWDNDRGLHNAHTNALMGSDSARAFQQHRDELVETWRSRTGGVVAESEAARAAARADELTAAAVLAQPLDGAAERADVEHDAEVLYDSAERRQQLADRLESAGVGEEAAEARILSDTSQAVPTNQAISRGAKAPKARPSRTKGRQQDKSISR
jgi:hypothetical protein